MDCLFFTDLDELVSECEQHRSTTDIAITENLTIRLYNLCKLNQNIVKTRFAFPTKAQKTETLSRGFLWLLNVLIIDDFLTAGYLVF